MFCSQNLGGVLNVALSLRGVHVLLRIFRGLQGFAAFGRKFEGPPPLGVFDTFPKFVLQSDKIYEGLSMVLKLMLGEIIWKTSNHRNVELF